MVHISCTWQNNDSSSSPTVITCNCSKAIHWGRGGTQGVSARKTLIGEGVFWEPLLTHWQKTELVRAGVPIPSTDRGGRELLLLPGHEGKQTEEMSAGSGWRRGRALPPHRKRNHSLPCQQHMAYCADPVVLTGMCKQQAFPEPTKAGGNTAHQLLTECRPWQVRQPCVLEESAAQVRSELPTWQWPPSLIAQVFYSPIEPTGTLPPKSNGRGRSVEPAGVFPP